MALFKEKKPNILPDCPLIALLFFLAAQGRIGWARVHIYMYLEGKLGKQSLNRSSAVCHFFAYR